MSYEQIPRKSTLSEVAQSSFIAAQAVSVELDSGSKGADLVVAPNWRTVTERTAPANDVRYGRNCTFAQAECSDSERELLDLLDERNSISANLATEAHKTRGTGINDQVWTAGIRMEWTPADKRRAAATKLDAVLLDYSLDRRQLTDLLGAETVRDPMLARAPQFLPKAKSIIWLFMEGGPSGVDLFDPQIGSRAVRRTVT